jgi:hypothetical protein
MKWRYAFRKAFAFDGGVCLREGGKRGMLVAVVYASEAGRGVRRGYWTAAREAFGISIEKIYSMAKRTRGLSNWLWERPVRCGVVFIGTRLRARERYWRVDRDWQALRINALWLVLSPARKQTGPR